MRVIIVILLIATVFSCKRIPENNTPKQTKNNVMLKVGFQEGDSLISSLDFIKTIDISCKRVSGVISDSKKQRNDFNKKCNFYKIKYDYDILRGLESKKTLFDNNNTSYYMALADTKSDADDYKFIKLYSSRNNKKLDSLTIFSYENYIEALVNKGTYFYIKNDKIYTYNYVEDEEGIHSKNWKVHEIKNGQFQLLKEISF